MEGHPRGKMDSNKKNEMTVGATCHLSKPMLNEKIWTLFPLLPFASFLPNT